MKRKTKIATCHPDRPHFAKGMCKLCHNTLWRRANPDRVRIHRKRKECISKYGITLDDRDAMIQAQNGQCAICHEHPEKLVIDHNHSTGLVREMLCNQCNWVLGMARERIDVLKNAVLYLEKHVVPHVP